MMYRIIDDMSGLCFRCPPNEARFWLSIAGQYTALLEVVEDVVYYGPIPLGEVK